MHDLTKANQKKKQTKPTSKQTKECDTWGFASRIVLVVFNGILTSINQVLNCRKYLGTIGFLIIFFLERIWLWTTNIWVYLS